MAGGRRCTWPGVGHTPISRIMDDVQPAQVTGEWGKGCWFQNKGAEFREGGLCMCVP